MKNQMRCKACGYIIREDKLKDSCPACGVPRTSFEQWKDTVSPRRRFILNLNLHPIALHFPQACSVMLPFLILADQFLPLPRGIELNQAVRVLGILVFPSALGAFIAGLVDGHARFKKITTPALISKIVIGLVFLGSAFALSFTAFMNYTIEPVRWSLFTLSLACIGFQIALAQIGKRLMCVYLPGK